MEESGKKLVSESEAREERRAREKAERDAAKLKWAEGEEAREAAREYSERNSSAEKSGGVDGNIERRITVEIVRKKSAKTWHHESLTRAQISAESMTSDKVKSRDEIKARDFMKNYGSSGKLGDVWRSAPHLEEKCRAIAESGGWDFDEFLLRKEQELGKTRWKGMKSFILSEVIQSQSRLDREKVQEANLIVNGTISAEMFETKRSTSADVKVNYVNYRGESAVRRIVPNNLRFGANEYHPGPGWLLECFDLDKGQDRVYSLADCDFRTLEERVLGQGAEGSSAKESGSVGRELSPEEQKLIDANLQTMDGSKWAEAFDFVAQSLGYPEMDQDWLVGWFSNAIMKGWDVRDQRARREAKKIPTWESLLGGTPGFKPGNAEWLESVRKAAVNQLNISAEELTAIDLELKVLEENMRIGAFGPSMSPRLLQLMNAMGMLIATGGSREEPASSGEEIRAEIGDVSGKLGEAIPAEEVESLVDAGRKTVQRELGRQKWVSASGDAEWPGEAGGRRFWPIEDDQSRSSSSEEILDKFVVTSHAGGTKVDLREPIVLNANTATVERLFSVLLAEVGLTKMEQLADLIGEEAFRRKNEWLNTDEKIAEAGLKRERINSVRVLWGPELQFSVLVNDNESVTSTGLRAGVLHCPQARSDDDAYAFGQMFLYGKQDPAEFPLIK